MTDHQQPAASLYEMWWPMVETAFRMAVPGLPKPATGEPGRTDAQAPSVPESVRPILQAIELNRRLISQFFSTVLPMPAAAAEGQSSPLPALPGAGQFAGLLESSAAAQKQFAEAGFRAFADLSRVWTGQPLAEFGAGMGQFDMGGLERIFGGVTDALGLRPSKALAEAWREMLAADSERLAAQRAYMTMFLNALGKAAEGVAKRQGEMAMRGESVGSVIEWVRLWASIAEQHVHQVMQSEAGLKVTSESIRSSLRYRQQRNRVVAQASEMLNVPTRAELDDAYREIQQLKRELREMRRELRALPRPRIAKDRTKEASNG